MAVVRASSASLEPSVASRIVVGEMLISSPPLFGGEEMTDPSPRCYTQCDQEPSGRQVRPVTRYSLGEYGGRDPSPVCQSYQDKDATSIARRECRCPRSVASCYSPKCVEEEF